MRLGGLWFDNVTMDEALERVGELVQARRPALVVTPNVDHVVRARRDPAYAATVAQAALVLADGQPLVWLSWMLGTPLKERVAGSDLLPRLCAFAAERGWRVFLLGGAPGAAAAARRVLVRRHPTLQVEGTYCPPMGFETDPLEQAKARAVVAAVRPQIVFVGLGSPKQERWIVENMHAYGPAVSIGVGISFSFVAGHVRRAPRWMQRCGLEWLHRVWQEPRRLAARYFLRGWSFVPMALEDLARVWLGGNGRVLAPPPHF
ncbi:MAG: WecB/TagA/CpsF family glycosyltransferase [Planctomycetota bacterium]